jgi:apolipoprotein N-acyltransferase
MESRNGPGNGQALIQPHRHRVDQRTAPAELLCAAASPSTSLRGPLLGAIACAGLLWLCYFPAACGWLAWVALVPLLPLVRAHLTWRRVFLAAWVNGLIFYFLAIKWMRVADYRMYFTWISLSLYCSLFVPAGILLVRRLDRATRLPLILTLPVVWVALEYFRAHVMTGFPWYFLGHSQHDFLAVAQVADLGGVYLVTAVVAAVNAAIFEWLYRGGWFRRLTGLPDPVAETGWCVLVGQAVLVAAVVSAAVVYGRWRLSQQDFAVGPRIALIQGNVDQRIRNEASSPDPEKAAETMFLHFNQLSEAAALQHPRPDLLVWPETSYPDDWVENPPGQPVPASEQLARHVRSRWGTNALLGLQTHLLNGEERLHKYNSALLISADGRSVARYDKIHRVPFGEYVPLREWLPWMDTFAPYDYPYSIDVGESLTRFPLQGIHFGALICYEDTDPYLARQYVRSDAGQPPADFLLNISNDGWFDGTSEHEEHLAICRFRAIESRRAVARAVNMGVSAIIDGNGRVLRPAARKPNLAPSDAPIWEVAWTAGNLPELPIQEWGRFKKVAAVIIGAMPIDHRYSVYAQWGDWLPQGCGLFLGLSLFWSVARVWPSKQSSAHGAPMQP